MSEKTHHVNLAAELLDAVRKVAKQETRGIGGQLAVIVREWLRDNGAKYGDPLGNADTVKAQKIYGIEDGEADGR